MPATTVVLVAQIAGPLLQPCRTSEYHIEWSKDAQDLRHDEWELSSLANFEGDGDGKSVYPCIQIAVKVETTAEASRVLRIPRNRRVYTRAECYIRVVLKITAIVTGN